jgi:hypothetical protein
VRSPAKRLLCGVFLLGLISATAPAWAWNAYSHMVIAAVAYEHLTPEARQHAQALLQLNPDYGRWIADVPPLQQAHTAFVLAATWADDIKSEPGYIDDGPRPDHASAADNIGYADHQQHRYWHFIDQPYTEDGSRAERPGKPNVQTQIGAFRATLASRTASADLRSYDLVWLLHLIGDIHQPLHAVSRFTQSQPQGDNGGNRVSLCRPPCRKELHGYWDDIVGRGRTPEAAIRRAQTLSDAQPSAVAIQDEAVWARESLALATSAVYVPPIGDGAGPYAPDAAYRARAREVAGAQVELAGERLALLLNRALAAH